MPKSRKKPCKPKVQFSTYLNKRSLREKCWLHKSVFHPYRTSTNYYGVHRYLSPVSWLMQYHTSKDIKKNRTQSNLLSENILLWSKLHYALLMKALLLLWVNSNKNSLQWGLLGWEKCLSINQLLRFLHCYSRILLWLWKFKNSDHNLLIIWKGNHSTLTLLVLEAIPFQWLFLSVLACFLERVRKTRHEMVLEIIQVICSNPHFL